MGSRGGGRGGGGSQMTAVSRLRQDFIRLKKDPVPYIVAEPLASNILEWRYVVTGPPDTPYEGGLYHGRLVFPPEFPFKPPSIYMITPNGRFETDTRLCLSISDYHPDTWNPAWSVSTILTGLLSFMLEASPTLGSIESSLFTKRQFAAKSHEFNLKDRVFCEMFPDLVEACRAILQEREAAAALEAQKRSRIRRRQQRAAAFKAAAAVSPSSTSSSSTAAGRRRRGAAAAGAGDQRADKDDEEYDDDDDDDEDLDDFDDGDDPLQAAGQRGAQERNQAARGAGFGGHGGGGRLYSAVANVIVIGSFAAFALIVRYVLQTISSMDT